MLKPSGQQMMMAEWGGSGAADETFYTAEQQRRNCLRSPPSLVTSGSLTTQRSRFLICCTVTTLLLLLLSLAPVASADDEIVSSAPRIVFKNEEFLNRKKIPDVQGVLQKPLNDKKFENLTAFLVTLKDALNDAGYQASPDTSFTIIVPKVDTKAVTKDRLKEFCLEHMVPGVAFTSFSEDDVYGNENLHKMEFTRQQTDGQIMWSINGVKILRMEIINDKLSVIFIDGVLGDKKGTFAKRNIQETNRYNEPQRLEMKNSTAKNEHTSPVKESVAASMLAPQPPTTTTTAAATGTTNKSGNLMGFLANMKSGTKVFQHFLAKTNLSHILDVPGGSYTVLIPSDNAFQRWHPIDWGFYPFSVQEFTENVLRNHFVQVKSPIRMDDLKKLDVEQTFKTLGGETVSFRSYPSPTVNNVTILSDFTLPNGNEVFLISEVLFVSEAVVSKLHQMHRDKETPPLLAFPWFGAQFLSHSFLALERDSRFTQITRFLNTAEIAPFVSGSNLTFFVPTDAAFERLGFDILPDDILGSEMGVKMLLNHFVKGRLYDRDLQNGIAFETIGGEMLEIQRKDSNVTVNQATIIESEVFVYNLGTMFYIDDVLFSNYLLGNPPIVTTTTTTASPVTKLPATTVSSRMPGMGSTESNAELVPNEITEPNGTDDDFLMDEDEFITPRALPVLVNVKQAK